MSTTISHGDALKRDRKRGGRGWSVCGRLEKGFDGSVDVGRLMWGGSWGLGLDRRVQRYEFFKNTSLQMHAFPAAIHLSALPCALFSASASTARLSRVLHGAKAFSTAFAPRAFSKRELCPRFPKGASLRRFAVFGVPCGKRGVSPLFLCFYLRFRVLL